MRRAAAAVTGTTSNPSSVNDTRHLCANIAARGDNEGFGDRAGRYEDIVLGSERADTGVGLGLIE